MDFMEALNIVDPHTRWIALAKYGRYGNAMQICLQDEACELVASTLKRFFGDGGVVEPLGLDELQDLKGKPVWVQPPSSPIEGFWAIVSNVHRGDDDDGDKLFLSGDKVCRRYGIDYLAFPLPPHILSEKTERG